MADTEQYRKKEEIERWRPLDPIVRFRQHLLDAGTITQADAERMQQDADEMAAEAARFAEESPEPPLESLTRGIFVETGGRDGA
jgi:pyruvate dehydrogenase E1 component alpha subunit